MQHIASQCTNCGAFTRRSLHHEGEYQSSVLLERLRTSNFPATDEEIAHIRHTILSTISDDISSIDSKVASLHEVIRSMEEERERLLNVRKRYSNLISLHRTLPSEIWSQIFLYTLSGASDSNAFDASGSIWKLSHVCQRWRNIALSLHSCWSTMDIRFPQAAQQEADVQRLETIIQRSRQGPLDVSLSDDISDTRTSNPSILKRIFDIVFTESHRWRKAHLSYTRGGWDILYAPLHNRLPRLESLSLFLSPLEREEQSVSVFGDFSRLTELTLGGGTPLVVDFPWDQITALDLSWLDHGGEEERRACMRLIGLCPSLEALALPSWISEDDEGESPYTPITCSNMLELHCTWAPVIEALTLPRLRAASLRPDPTYDILYSFKKLLIRSSCLSALTSLSLANVPLAISPEHVHSILSQTHSLTILDLAVYMHEYDDQTDASDRDHQTDASDHDQIVAIVKSLKVVPTKSVTFLPLLSYLRIRVYKHYDPSRLLYFGPVGSFASTLKSRWEGDDMVGLARLSTCHFAVEARHLQHIVYRGAGSFVQHIFNEAERFIFNGLVDDGMDLAIRVTSDLTENFRGNNVVFAVPS